MPRPLAWICLMVVLAGPSLVHAEAADDLARSLVGTQDEGQVRPTDGGVGDDPIEASFGPSAPGSGMDQPAWPARDDPAMARVVGLLRAGPVSTRHRRRGDSWPFPAPLRRHVWLRTFRI